MNGDQLKRIREQRGWTQQEAARRLGVSQPYLSLLERGQRPVTPLLARCASRVFGLPPTALSPADPFAVEVPLSERELAENLANLGYPGFAYMRSRRPKKNPAEVLLAALVKDDLEPRITEGLPWLLLVFPDWNTDWLVRQARQFNLQNRLGFVVNLARRAAERVPRYRHRALELLRLEQQLEPSRLARQDTLCWATLPEVKRRWLAANRPPEAAYWNLLTDWRPEQLRYAV
ncbi:MAG: helix-turn-helix domain-containing protein [Terriglobia bacterium]